MLCEWGHKIFEVDESGFEPLVLEIFQFQYRNNALYKSYVDALQYDVTSIHSLIRVPFLPIRFFKSHIVQTGNFKAEVVFESSGTTSTQKSLHYIKSLDLYEASFRKGFELFYGPVNEWCIIGLLPSYLDRKNSSLVYMVNKLIRWSGREQSGFYLNEMDELFEVLLQLEEKGQKTLLIGVSFALLEFAEKYNFDMKNTVLMETGGMKGQRKDMIREELHDLLKKAFQTTSIHSEYGMTELLSQAYSKKDGIFQTPPWMKVLLRDEEDHLTIKDIPVLTNSKTISGVINVIDLANIYSCSFIATEDIGKLYADGSFEVLGRLDNSDMRGCSLMTT